MHLYEDHVLSNDGAKYAEMPAAGVCFRESPTFGQVYAYLGHISVGSAEFLSQSTTVNPVCRSRTSSKVYSHQYNGTVYARSIIAPAAGPHDQQVGLREVNSSDRDASSGKGSSALAKQANSLSGDHGPCGPLGVP